MGTWYSTACGCGCHHPLEVGDLDARMPCEYCREDRHSDTHPTTITLHHITPLDPDGEPMTTFPAPLDGDTITEVAGSPTLHTDKATLIAYNDTEVASLIRRANAVPSTRAYVQKAKNGEGTGTLGLYVEAVVLTTNGNPFTHMKFFVVGSNVYAYSRTTGDSRANWRRRETQSLEAAVRMVQAALDRENVRMFGHPVLVELTAADLSQVESGGIPEGRFRGQYRIEKDFGRYDFKMDIRSTELPLGLTQALRKGHVIPNAV
jgi:hypothetical protein